MSLAHFEIQCERCGFETVNPDEHIERVYLLPEGNRIRAMVDPAWCDDCGGFRMVESFTDRKTAEAELRQMIAERDRMAEIPKESRPGEFYNFGWRIERLEQFLPFYEHRQTPPRCLTCGGGRFTPVRIPRPAWEKTEVMEFAHPGCGGRLLVTESPMRFMRRPWTKVFDTGGTFIRDEYGRTT